MGLIKDITGQKFGQLTVLKYAYTNHGAVWQCKCDCGNIVEVRGDQLRNNHTRSCGCLHRSHGKSNTRLYYIWKHIKDRCYNKNGKRYEDYGGRGIAVCDEWKKDFQAFYNWAIKSGYQEGLTIDRIDVNDNYRPDNCRWTTMKVQQRNKRNNKMYTISSETHCLSEWCEIFGLNYDKVYCRIYRNKWPIERALELEVK